MGHSTIFYSPDTKGAEAPDRSQIDEQYKWNLSPIYENLENWNSDFSFVEEKIKEYKNFAGKLKESPENILNCFKLDDEIGGKIQRLYLYSYLNKDSDLRNEDFQALSQRIAGLNLKVEEASSFIKPELLEISEETLLSMIDSNDGLKLYSHVFDELFKNKKHTLSKEIEQILALSSETLNVPYNTFQLLNNADTKYPVIQDDEGNDIEITPSKYISALHSKDRGYRERAYKNFYTPFRNYVNTYSSLFNGGLKSKIFISRARKFGSAREAALSNNFIPISVYDALIKNVSDNLKPLHRWAALKKKLLKIDELHPYDVYVSIFDKGDDKHYPYEEAKELILKAFSVFGDDYLNSVKKALNERWIDVYETKNKRSGAYSSGTTFGVHPYILLNYEGLLTDVFTLAHELGHNMHSYYTGLNQPYPYSNYTIFLAEVASTFNESVLLNYLINNSADDYEKLKLIELYLNNISSTFYRQTMFAEFEMLAYQKSENDEALTPIILRNLYKSLYSKYWGEEMVIDEEEEFTWARVPHFYYNFYVYQYATGYAASQTLLNNLIQDGSTVNKYLEFLKSGSSDYSINILKKSGVDMESSEPVLAVIKIMEKLLNEAEVLINKLKF